MIPTFLNRDCGHHKKLLNLGFHNAWTPTPYNTLIIYYHGVVSFHEAVQYERSAIHVLAGITETTCMSIRHRDDSRYTLVSDNAYKSCSVIISLDSQLLEFYRVDKHFPVTSDQYVQSRGIRNACAVAMRYTAMLRCNTTSDRPFRS
jgi:hypothetical protein